MKLRCPARIRTRRGETFYGECVELTVEGLSVHSEYVPQFREMLEIIVTAPDLAGKPVAPLRLTTEVMHCCAVEPGSRFEMAMTIVARSHEDS